MKKKVRVIYAFPGLGKSVLALKSNTVLDTDSYLPSDARSWTPAKRTALIKSRFANDVSGRDTVLTNVPDLVPKFDVYYLPTKAKLQQIRSLRTDLSALPLGDWYASAQRKALASGGEIVYIDRNKYLSDYEGGPTPGLIGDTGRAG